ncbi:MAG: acyl-CoA dehydrogenase [Alphaproteobacteria bacterium]|nr:acyl-CoA dehydrogenase [Alphaproteobacteria bacterium]
MTHYAPPLRDIHFTLTDVLGFQNSAIDIETMEAIFDEAGKLASEVLAPLNTVGDETGARLENGAVTTAPGFKEAYAQYRDAGWNAVPFDEAYGGQGLPYAVAFPVQEMWQSANMSFGLCPLLNQGAVEAINHHGSDAQKNTYLSKLISGEWTGTMNLTEPQAGSDLGLIRTKAVPQADGTYAITGQKIFITYGEHDMADNIIHLVLARIEGAPEDVKGISLFIVPKVLEDGARNQVNCIGLEHKLGIHGSPTCTMSFDNARGELVGTAHEGLKYMFTMMNNARLSVGLQGVAIAERATQKALEYAAERVQGKSLGSGARVPIADHADVKRMLLTMQALTQAGRALTYEAALALDAGDKGKVELLTPIVKAWCTDNAVEVASLGVQVHGGMGFIEETGAAQFYRDARILPIYEGTNGIQAADLAFRKILRDQGAEALKYIKGLEADLPSAYTQGLKDTIQHLCKASAEEAAASAVPLLKAFAISAGGALMSRAGKAAKAVSVQDEFTSEKIRVAEFYRSNILPLALAQIQIAQEGAAPVIS